MHWFSILMVAVGATISAFWIIVANSWQQTPAGYTINETLHRAELTSFCEAVFNPSTHATYAHTVMAALVTGTFFMAGVCGSILRRDRRAGRPVERLAVAVVCGLIFSVLVAFPTGHEHAQQVARTQPEKFAAMEGLYETQKSAPLVAFGIVQGASAGTQGEGACSGRGPVELDGVRRRERRRSKASTRFRPMRFRRSG